MSDPENAMTSMDKPTPESALESSGAPAATALLPSVEKPYVEAGRTGSFGEAVERIEGMLRECQAALLPEGGRETDVEVASDRNAD